MDPEAATLATTRSSLRRVPARWHGLLDYAASLAFVGLPFALGLDPTAARVSVAVGVLLAGYSLLADYGLGIVGLFSIRTHLLLDLAAGSLLVVLPFLVGAPPAERTYFVAMGLGVFAAVLVTRVEDPRT